MTIRTLGCWLGASVVLHVSSSPRGVTLLRVLGMLGAVLAGVRADLLLDATLPLHALEHLVPETVADLLADTRREIHLANSLPLESGATVTSARRWLTIASATTSAATTSVASATPTIPSNELAAVWIVNPLTGFENQGVVEVRSSL
jgi:hypothetical protein